MLDLKAKLAAAGVVTQDQVKDFDSKQAKAREEAARKKSQPKAPNKGNRGNGKSTPTGHRPRAAASVNDKAGFDVDGIKKLKKGEAYDRLRKLVTRNRLDDSERTIPGPDDHAFNFVTQTGRISKLYLKDETSSALREGSAAISAFMSHHGLAHCVLPKAVAIGIAEIFPLWLRHLRDHPAAGLIEEVPPPVVEAKDGDSQSPPVDK